MTATVSTPTDRLLMTAREAAATLAISERTLWSLTKCGDIAHVRAGRRVLYSPADLAAWIDRQRSAALASGPSPSHPTNKNAPAAVQSMAGARKEITQWILANWRRCCRV